MNINDCKKVIKNKGIKNALLVGSRALYNDREFNNDTDIDIVASRDSLPDKFLSKIKDGMLVIHGNHPIIEVLIADDATALNDMYNSKNFGILDDLGNKKDFFVAPKITLLIMKLGHIHRCHNYKKWLIHMDDIIYMFSLNLKSFFDYDYFRLMVKNYRLDTDNRLGKQKLPKLDVTKSEFFDDGVKKYIDHDYLHIVYAHDDEPIYKKMQYENDEVMCRYELWVKLSRSQKIKAVLEEAYVIASERYVIPKLKRGDKDIVPVYALYWAIMRICTDLTGGFFRDFAIMNYASITKNMNFYYHKKLKFLDFYDEHILG